MAPTLDHAPCAAVAAEPAFRNFLYDHPPLYEKVFADYAAKLASATRIVFSRHLTKASRAILDIGCGTGQVLNLVLDDGDDGAGLDASERMISYGRSKYPRLQLKQCRMQSFSFDRRFDAFLMLGSVLNYALADEDLDGTLVRIIEHAKPDAVLFMSFWNSGIFLGDGSRTRQLGMIDCDGFSAELETVYSFCLKDQLMQRQRTWRAGGQVISEDQCTYRMYFPREIKYRLERFGLTVIGIYGDTALETADLNGSGCYLVAKVGQV